MDPQRRHIMTIANSIIGVSILAMPYCFKQCGILLSILLLFVSSYISRLSCHFLLKSAIKARLRTFEYLAYHAFGALGKFVVEIGIIGFLMGTCIAFFVVMGDLAPGIVVEITKTQVTSTLRTTILISIAIFCVLPLGLLRNVESLSAVCTATVGFYLCLVLKIIAESTPHILLGDWYDNVYFWKPSGILQCLPIFSMALFCQTQLFEIYQAIPNASLEKMNSLIRVAVNICTFVYIFVGIFGYIALSHQPTFSGNILMSFTPSIMTEVMKIGFVLSVAFSFPLVIFPCRASLNSLLYKKVHDGASNYIPEGKFKLLTFSIVLVSLVIGVMIPNIELVLGLVGSTIGVMICVLFPAACFICLSLKNTNERLLAQVMLFIGIVVMVLGTYANLYAFEEAASKGTTERTILAKISEPNFESIKINMIDVPTMLPLVDDKKDPVIPDVNLGKVVVFENEVKQIRHEPPQPEEPMDIPSVNKAAESKQVIKATNEKVDGFNELADKVSLEDTNSKEKSEASKKLIENQLSSNLTNKQIPANNMPLQMDTPEKEKVSSKAPKADEVDIEAIKKEEKEIQEDEKQLDIMLSLKQRKDVQMQLDEVQKQLQEIKIKHDKEEQHENEINKKVNEEKLKAVKAIESMAKEAIASLTNNKRNVQNEVTLELDEEKKEGDKNKENVVIAKKNEANNTIVNAAPLSYQLGLNKNKSMPESYNLKNMIPLPLAGSNYLNKTNNLKAEIEVVPKQESKENVALNEKEKQNPEIKISSTVTSREQVLKLEIKKVAESVDANVKEVKIEEKPLIQPAVLDESSNKKEPEAPKIVDSAKEDIQAIRRDLLSDNEKPREKRDVEADVETCDKAQNEAGQVLFDGKDKDDFINA